MKKDEMLKKLDQADGMIRANNPKLAVQYTVEVLRELVKGRKK